MPGVLGIMANESQAKRLWDPKIFHKWQPKQAPNRSLRKGTCGWISSSGEEAFETLRTGNIGTSPSYWTSPMQTRRRRYTCEEAVLITMDQLPLPPRRARVNTTLVRDMSFDERSHKLATLAVESFGRLGVEGSNFIDQPAASVVGGRDGRSMASEGVVGEPLLQIISVTTQVAISRRVARFKLQLRDRQETKRSRGGGDDRPTPTAWGWSLDAT